MPNISPMEVRGKYAIYDNKAHRAGQAIEGIKQLSEELSTIGYHIDLSRGDYQD